VEEEWSEEVEGDKREVEMRKTRSGSESRKNLMLL
jgi:hypothetical protein